MKFRISFFMWLFLFSWSGWESPAAVGQELGISWEQYLGNSREPISPLSDSSSRAFYLLETETGVKLGDLQSEGMEILRRIDDRHFIVSLEKRKNQENRLSEKRVLYPANHRWKLSPTLLQKQNENLPHQKALFTIKGPDLKLLKDKISDKFAGLNIVNEYTPAGLLVISCTYSTLFNSVLPLPEVSSIDELNSHPLEESQLLDANLTINKINLVHHVYPTLKGEGMVASIKEQKFNPDDLDLLGRYISTDQEAESVSRHATDIATIVGGAGNSSPKGMGVAPESWLVSSDYGWLFPDPDEYFSSNGIYVQNHSYGTAIENYYGAQAHAYDVQTHRNPSLVHVFSAGNDGIATDTFGTYKGVEAFANLTGNFKMAKNGLVVGALDSLKQPDFLVSKGPAYDGRVKPEVVAYSAAGSSNAAALVSGVVLLLQQAYQQEWGIMPPSALLKAVLVNTAEDVGPEGIDFYSGYGNVNAFQALEILLEQEYLEDTVSHQQEVLFTIEVPENARNMRVSLVWNDPAAEPNSSKALINDLDLELLDGSTGSALLPWVLNSFPHPDSLQLPAFRKPDHLNTVEQVSLRNPEPGTYTLKVSGFDVPQGPQQFYVAYSWEEAESFRWTYPTGSDHMPYLGERSSIFQWETSYVGEKGLLEYSLDGGESWETIEEEVDLEREYYQWKAPEVFSTAQARMIVGNKIYRTDTFSISRSLKPSVGFNCTDSVMLLWPSVPGARAYELYSMGDRELELVSSGADTFVVLQKADFRTRFFAVAPVLDEGKSGIRSTTFDYSLQGVDCYLSFFNVRGEEEGVQLDLQVGTSYQLSKVHFERKGEAGFVAVQTFEPGSELELWYLDKEVQQGVNEYRARLELANGQVLLTEPTVIYFMTKLPFLVFPNPVGRQEALHVYSKDFADKEVQLMLFTDQGQLVMNRVLLSGREEVQVSALAPGVYFYTLIAGDLRRSGKIFVY